ncbi:hypothetical protein [Fulvivirga kasyanovii]|uniref:Lipoprotein n=1 Tax=Fulvivirga kasyanovii TaxID=396812 RepID=A0ABW9RNZ3_9BACT|nr:hypothetical protein [Fulvivirga kasyanovii]MTI25053.1 hypothetical protein [Fulvivirga kasyanovii]
MMRWRAIILLSLITLLQSSCAQKEESLIGHWHLNSDNGFFNTIDINDTVSSANYYELEGYGYTLPRAYDTLNVLPFDDFFYTSAFELRGDRLLLSLDTVVIEYIKADIQTCIYKHRYARPFVEVDLHINDDAYEFEKAVPNSCGANVFVGPLKTGEGFFYDSLASAYPDSMFIQVNDVMIKFMDLPQLAKQTYDMCIDQPFAGINFHIDKSVPREYIDRLINSIPDSLKLEVNTVARMSNGDIGLVRVR